MCGINGIVSFQKSSVLTDKVKLMNAALAHRGPDSDGLFSDESVALGFRRLSIIDLSPLGNQPMSSADGNLVMVFNGEIYNFNEIKKELKLKEYAFRSNSDTEVILYAYKEWGTAAFSHFNGMFAIAIYDKLKNIVILARDHAGIKPLYYHFKDKKLLFSSEIRGFKAYNPHWPVESSWPVYFLSFGFIPFPFTTLKDIFTLPKGSFLTLDLSSDSINETAEIKSYHTFSFSNSITSESEALLKVRESMLAAVNRHMIADAPLGIFLSGGIDSSLIALCADHLGHKDLNTLSITFDEASYNEEPYQDIVLKQMRPHHHKAYKVNCGMFMDQLDDIFKAMDQPSWDGVNSYFISQCAHEAGLKAVLSGLGGDELFGGYPSFHRIGLLNKLSFLPRWTTGFTTFSNNSALSRIAFLKTNTKYRDYLFLRGAFNPSVTAKLAGIKESEVNSILEDLILSDYPAKRDMNLAAYLETNIYMENQLLKDTDYMSMWHSLEVRVPFLDKDLMELMHKIHPSVKFNFSQPKFLLTKAFSDLLPPEIIFRKKQGFTFPFSIWLKNNISHFMPMLPETPLTNTVLQNFVSGKTHWSHLWALIIMKKFMN